ncbi:MAG: 5'/3'-nucleotidase SurE [Chitinivibrionia bacterium]|nr:5'/3'-nucleotidase SurE [Chitinivibrionia bacterium]
MQKLILITNDDGIRAPGLKVLAAALRGLGTLVTIAPGEEQSASSHSLTIRERIRVEHVSKHSHVVWGTPADCVLLGVQGIMSREPDLIVSGINHGPNMGEDVTYSGTVAAAIEGTILGIPSVAFSSLQRTIESADEIGSIARAIVTAVLANGVPKETLLNVNIPDPAISPIKGVKITKLGSRSYGNILNAERSSPGEENFTIAGDEPVWKDDNGTDIAAVRMGYVSITPLHLDLTNYKAIVEMERWRFEL